MRAAALTVLTALLAALLAGGCSETVSFLTIDLQLPSLSPPITCKADPRRAQRVEVSATCDGEVLRASAAVSAGSVGLEGLPMAECAIAVAALNIFGRAVLKGEGESAVMARGENESLTIQLLEPACDRATCDADGDRVPDVDEQGLGTDPESLDSDGDGLEDGLELTECCTDPTSDKDAECSKFLIQGVYPALGPAGTAVLIRSTATLKSPSASVGGKPLDNLFADSTIVLGQVAKDAALGEVVLGQAGGSKAIHSRLFGVLVGSPELVTEISQRALGIAPSMYVLVDQAFAGPFHLLLGGSAGSTLPALPVLIQVDHSKPVTVATKALVPGGGAPLGLAVSSKLLLVLTRSSAGKPQLVIYPVSSTGGVQLSGGKKVSFGNLDTSAPAEPLGVLAEPLGVLAEPGGDVFQLLTKKLLVRLRIDGNSATVSQAAAVELRGLISGPDLSGATAVAPLCTGGAFYLPKGASSADQGVTLLTCDLPPGPCPAGLACPGQGHLVRAPVSACLKLGSGLKPSSGKSCGSAQRFSVPSQAFGAPVVDVQSQRIYVLSSAGVVADSVTASTKPLEPHVKFSWARKLRSQHVMTLSGQHLFVVDGPEVRRLEPAQDAQSARLGRAFAAGSITEEATMLVLSPDGKVLVVGRQLFGSLSSVMGVCLAPPCS